MYKVYINIDSKNSDIILQEDIMKEILENVKKNLIEADKFIVYSGINKTKKEIIEESDNIKSDLHIVIQNTKENSKGPIVYIKTASDSSNGFGKEIYKKVMKIYNDKNIDNAIDFDTKIVEIEKAPNSGVALMLFSVDNKQDQNWVLNNIISISKAISDGIIEGFKLRPC